MTGTGVDVGGGVAYFFLDIDGLRPKSVAHFVGNELLSVYGLAIVVPFPRVSVLMRVLIHPVADDSGFLQLIDDCYQVNVVGL